MSLNLTRSARIAVALHVFMLLWAAAMVDSGRGGAAFAGEHGLSPAAAGEVP